MVLTIPPEARSPNMENAFFDIWALDRSRAIDIRKLSWSSKPPREKLLGTFSAQGPATQQTQPHECLSGTYQHIEISCREGPCDLHIIASGSEEFNGTSSGPLDKNSISDAQANRDLYDAVPDNLGIAFRWEVFSQDI